MHAEGSRCPFARLSHACCGQLTASGVSVSVGSVSVCDVITLWLAGVLARCTRSCEAARADLVPHVRRGQCLRVRPCMHGCMYDSIAVPIKPYQYKKALTLPTIGTN